MDSKAQRLLRRKDLPDAARLALRPVGEDRERPVHSIRSEALEQMRRYPFPRNVHELSNTIERAVVFCSGESLDLSDLPARMRGPEPSPLQGTHTQQSLFDLTHPPPLRTLEQRYVHYVLEQTEGNKQKSARLLRIGRRTLYRYLEEGGSI